MRFSAYLLTTFNYVIFVFSFIVAGYGIVLGALEMRNSMQISKMSWGLFVMGTFSVFVTVLSFCAAARSSRHCLCIV
jgi:hypothetical protein